MYYITADDNNVATIHDVPPEQEYIEIESLPIARPNHRYRQTLMADVGAERLWYSKTLIPDSAKVLIGNIRMEASSGIGINAEWLAYIYESVVLGIEPVSAVMTRAAAYGDSVQEVTESDFSPPAKGYATLVQEGRRTLGSIPDERDRAETIAYLRYRFNKYPTLITDPDLIAEITETEV